MPGSPASPEAKPAAGQGSGRMQIWVASDGTAGMRLQALAWRRPCSARGRDWTLDEFTVSPHRLIRALPRLAAAVPGLPLYAASGGGRCSAAHMPAATRTFW